MRIMLVLLLALAIPAHAAMPAVKVEKINDRVYALLGPMEFPNKKNQGYMVNSTVIIGDKGVILVDTGSTDVVGKHLAQAIAKITPKPVTHIINTHHHGDHTLGNISFPNTEVISAEKCKELVEKTGAEWVATMESMTEAKWPNTKPVPAKVTYKENTRTDVTINGVKLTLWVPHGSHTPGDMLVYLPDDKVLIGGDVLVNGIMPVFRDAHVKDWSGTLAEVQKFDFKTIVPGHGPLMTKPQAMKLAKMLDSLYKGVEAGYKKGLTDSEIRKTLNLKDWERLVHYEDNMGGNINRAYLEVEAANF